MPVHTAATYSYDPLGRRAAKTVTGGGNAQDLRFIYDGMEVIAETNAANQTVRRYVFGPGIDEPIAMYNGAIKRFYLTDPQGSVIGLTDDAGTLQAQHRYSAYGVPDQYAPPLEASGNALRYTGQRLDPETGLYYYRARYYSPTLGRFLQTDPIGYGDGLNLYAYVGNDPVNFRDPQGLAAEVAKQSLQGSFNLVAGGYQRTFVNPLQVTVNAIAQTPFGDPGVYASLQGIGVPPVSALAGAGRLVATGIQALATSSRSVRSARSLGVIAKSIPVSRTKYGEAASHIADAQRVGYPEVLTISRPGTAANRAAATSGLPKIPGRQLDEYPPAMFKEGGVGASVRPISPRDNMAAGACIGNACRGLPDGARVRISVVD